MVRVRSVTILSCFLPHERVGEEMAGVADDLSHCVWEAGGACGPHAKRWGSRRERA
jgi:hypothetical protein